MQRSSWTYFLNTMRVWLWRSLHQHVAKCNKWKMEKMKKRIWEGFATTTLFHNCETKFGSYQSFNKFWISILYQLFCIFPLWRDHQLERHFPSRSGTLRKASLPISAPAYSTFCSSTHIPSMTDRTSCITATNVMLEVSAAPRGNVRGSFSSTATLSQLVSI